MANIINNLKTYMDNKEQNDLIYIKEAPLTEEAFKQSKFEYDQMIKNLEANKDTKLLEIVTNLYEGKTTISEISKRKDLLEIIGSSESFDTLTQALETRFRRLRNEAKNSLSFNIFSIKCYEESKELEILRSNLHQAISIKNGDYESLQKFAKRNDIVKLISSHPEWYIPYGRYAKDFVIPLRVILENELENKQNLRSDELSIIDVSKREMTKERFKLKETLQEIYDAFDLSFSQTTLTETYYSNPQQLAIDLKNGNISMEPILYEIEKNIQNRPFDTKSIASFLNGKESFEILSYLHRHASKNQYEYYSACTDYINNSEEKENKEIYIITNIFKNLSIAKDDINNDGLDISNMVKYASKLHNYEFEGDTSISLGKIKNDSSSYNLKGLYFDKYLDGVRIKIEINGNEQQICVPKEVFIEETKKLLNEEFQNEKVKQETLNNCNFVDTSVINDLILEKKEIEF